MATEQMADEAAVRKALRKVKDPELNLDLVVLGLIYDVSVTGDHAHVTMSLTTPMCPAADQIVTDAKREVEAVEGIDHADIELTFNPPWSPERMDPLIRSSLGL
jgi:metal-sulfur cluster biosynthetic enzyme